MKGFVVDCSVTMSWFLRDHPAEYAEKVLRALEKTSAVAPGLWMLEVLNVLLVSERRGRVTREQSLRALAHLRSLPIRIEATEESSSPEALLRLAGDHKLSSYDAAYLDSAMRRGLPIATLDDGLRRACRAASVSLFAP